MFYSVGNNFGAGPIKFKEARGSNYIVLNATFKFDSRNAQYAAADVLEIRVPDLNIGRSTETGVIMYFPDSIEWYGTLYVLDSGVFVKSWIKDKNTICIEKLSYFDNKEEVTVFIQAMYSQLGQGSNTVLVTRQQLVDVADPPMVYFDSTDSIIVVQEKWAFVHLLFDRVHYDHTRDDWTATFENMPADIKTVLPLLFRAYWNGDFFTGCARPTVENQVWSLPFAGRGNDLNNSEGDPFSYAFIVRGDDDE